MAGSRGAFGEGLAFTQGPAGLLRDVCPTESNHWLHDFVIRLYCKNDI